jgi:predicted RNA-binding Zn ribbon-like protein
MNRVLHAQAHVNVSYARCCFMNIDSHFHFSVGRLSLDLVATVRHHASMPRDMLEPAGAASRWLEAACLTDMCLLLSATEEKELITLREAIRATVKAACAHAILPDAAVALLNHTAAEGLPIPYLDINTGRVIVSAPNPFKSALSMIARDAIDLVAGPALDQVKACAQDDCRTLFLDASRNSRRRWCSMDRCGSRAKAMTFRERHREALHEH